MNARTGEVSSRTLTDGKAELKTEHMNLPPDICNGMLPGILENLPPHLTESKLGFVSGTAKPRLVGLSIRQDGTDTFRIDGAQHKALRYVLHVDIGGVAGLVAPILGKEPTDVEIWVEEGQVHTLVKMQGALYLKGPIWTMELTSPSWRR